MDSLLGLSENDYPHPPSRPACYIMNDILIRFDLLTNRQAEAVSVCFILVLSTITTLLGINQFMLATVLILGGLAGLIAVVMKLTDRANRERNAKLKRAYPKSYHCEE